MYPDNLKYTKDHEWINQSATPVEVGVTSFAVEQLGDIVHLDLPDVGSDVKHGDAFGTIESTKTVSDLYSPISGKVVKVNKDLTDAPESLQSAENGKKWLIKVESAGETAQLLSAAEYEAYIKE
jgi:glycine cleavage system H protein